MSTRQRKHKDSYSKDKIINHTIHDNMCPNIAVNNIAC